MEKEGTSNQLMIAVFFPMTLPGGDHGMIAGMTRFSRNLPEGEEGENHAVWAVSATLVCAGGSFLFRWFFSLPGEIQTALMVAALVMALLAIALRIWLKNGSATRNLNSGQQDGSLTAETETTGCPECQPARKESLVQAMK